MDIQDKRINNLKQLIKAFSTQKAFAEEYELSYSFMNQLINKKRGFGEKAAKKIEEAMNLPEGWLSDLDRKETEQIVSDESVDSKAGIKKKTTRVDATKIAVNFLTSPPKGMEKIAEQFSITICLLAKREFILDASNAFKSDCLNQAADSPPDEKD